MHHPHNVQGMMIFRLFLKEARTEFGHSIEVARLKLPDRRLQRALHALRVCQVLIPSEQAPSEGRSYQEGLSKA